MIPKYGSMYHVIPIYGAMYHVMPKYGAMYHVMPIYGAMYHVIPKYGAMYHVMPKYGAMYHVIPPLQVCGDGSISRFDGIHTTLTGGEKGPCEVYQLEGEFPLERCNVIRHLTMVSPNKAICVAVVNGNDSLLTVIISLLIL